MICTLLIGVVPAIKGSSVNALENVAVTEVLAFRVTVQVPVPVQPPPLQPLKVETESVAAVKSNEILPASFSEQSEPQLMPGPVTIPSPEPAFATLRAKEEAETPVPVTALVAPAPPVKLRFPAKLPAEVGLKRTVTV